MSDELVVNFANREDVRDKIPIALRRYEEQAVVAAQAWSDLQRAYEVLRLLRRMGEDESGDYPPGVALERASSKDETNSH